MRLVFASGIGLDHGVGPGLDYHGPQGVAVLSGIRNHFLRRGQPRGQQAGCLRRVPGRARCYFPAQHVARAVGDQMYFARVAVPTAP